MDVGNPSNFFRIKEMFNNDYELIKNIIFSRYFSDEETIGGIKEVHKMFGYMIDPHGAVGYLALKEFLQENKSGNINGIILETAHPAKFMDVIEGAIGEKIIIPERLKSCLGKEKKSTKISSDFYELNEFLINY
jgi:threonine synthase